MSRILIALACLVGVGCQGPNTPLPGPSPLPPATSSPVPTVETPGLALRATVSPSPLYAGEPAYFSAFPSLTPTAPASFVWSFGDGQQATTSVGSVSHAYALGSYRASVSVTDGDQRTASADVPVTVIAAPVVPTAPPPVPVPVPGFVPSLTCTVGAGGVTPCNLTVGYHGAVLPSANVKSVVWDYGDGQTATTVPPNAPVTSHTYQSGTFTLFATVTATTVDGPQTATVSQVLAVQ